MEHEALKDKEMSKDKEASKNDLEMVRTNLEMAQKKEFVGDLLFHLDRFIISNEVEWCCLATTSQVEFI